MSERLQAHLDDVHWVAMRDLPGFDGHDHAGMEGKFLGDLERGPWFYVVRHAPGTRIPRHTHAGGVTHLLLEGEWDVGGERCTAGHWHHEAPGVFWGPVESGAEGSTCVAVYDRYPSFLPERNPSDLPVGLLFEMHRRMLRIRRFEERVAKLVARGQLPGAVHTSIGQEAEVVGACLALNDIDTMTGNHRSHGHPIGKGSPLGPLMAELFGKSTGVCKGKGGSMHLADFAVGSLGESGIVGSGIPIATGAALSHKLGGEGRVSLSFFGDGAANQGGLYESLNLASIWALPVVFLCENNQYASTTASRDVLGGGSVAGRAGGFGVPGLRVEDGQDVVAVHSAVTWAVERARRDEGPTVVEVMTYRYGEHSEGLRHAGAYRDADELARYVARDPIERHELVLLECGVDPGAVAALEAEVLDEVEAAVRFAKDSPDPDPAAAFEDLYT